MHSSKKKGKLRGTESRFPALTQTVQYFPFCLVFRSERKWDLKWVSACAVIMPPALQWKKVSTLTNVLLSLPNFLSSIYVHIMLKEPSHKRHFLHIRLFSAFWFWFLSKSSNDIIRSVPEDSCNCSRNSWQSYFCNELFRLPTAPTFPVSA